MATELTSQDLLAVVHDPRSAVDLERYFVGTNGALALTGSRFESLCGGGDREETANLIAADDLVAVELLSVNVPQLAALALLEGPLGRAVAEQLSLIRTDVDLGTPAAADALAPGAPARKAYTLLESPRNIGWVTATKLLARKRPRLVPVYDRVVRCAVGAPAGPWWWFHERFAENNYELATVLRELRLTVEVPDRVSPPRVLDVVLWMRHHHTHRTTHCARVEFPDLMEPRSPSLPVGAAGHTKTTTDAERQQ